MARGKTLSVVFKSGHQNQGMLLPPDLNDLIAPHHPVRVVNEVLEKVDITGLLHQYKPGGTSSYHPRMLLIRSTGSVVSGYKRHCSPFLHR